MINKLKSRTYDFLRWSQKYTGTDNVYLAKGGFWLTLGQIISAGASFLLAIAFANLLDPVTYGNYKYIISIVGILGIFSLSGMGTAITQAVARGLEGSFYTGFKTKLKWSLLGSLAAIGGAVYYWLRGNDLLPIPLLISAIFLPLMQASQIYGSFLTGKKLFNAKVKYSSFSQIISVVVIIAALFLTKNLFWLIAVYLISHTILNFFFYWFTQKRFQPNKKEDSQTLLYGKHLSLMDVLSTTSAYIDKILLFTLVGSTQLAIYSFAIIIPDQINSILKNINTLALPKLSTKSLDQTRSTLISKIKKMLLILIPIVIVYWIAAPHIYKIFFPQYGDSIPYSRLLMLSLVTVLTSLIVTAFQSQMMKRELYLTKLFSLVQIFLLVVLIPLIGIWGAVYAILCSKILNFFFVFYLFIKNFSKSNSY
jgi:O-antigen/teichoic acid export membrane protein